MITTITRLRASEIYHATSPRGYEWILLTIVTWASDFCAGLVSLKASLALWSTKWICLLSTPVQCNRLTTSKFIYSHRFRTLRLSHLRSVRRILVSCWAWFWCYRAPSRRHEHCTCRWRLAALPTSRPPQPQGPRPQLGGPDDGDDDAWWMVLKLLKQTRG